MPEDSDVFRYLIQNAHIIFIDEAQFMDSQLVQLCDSLVNEHSKMVWVFGLNGDANRKKFGYISDLLPLAESFTMLSG